LHEFKGYPTKIVKTEDERFSIARARANEVIVILNQSLSVSATYV